MEPADFLAWHSFAIAMVWLPFAVGAFVVEQLRGEHRDAAARFRQRLAHPLHGHSVAHAH